MKPKSHWTNKWAGPRRCFTCPAQKEVPGETVWGGKGGGGAVLPTFQISFAAIRFQCNRNLTPSCCRRWWAEFHKKKDVPHSRPFSPRMLIFFFYDPLLFFTQIKCYRSYETMLQLARRRPHTGLTLNFNQQTWFVVLKRRRKKKKILCNIFVLLVLRFWMTRFDKSPRKRSHDSRCFCWMRQQLIE